MQRKKLIALLATFLFIGIASAAIIPYFGRIETTVNVTQAVLLDGKDYTTPIIREISGTGGQILYSCHTVENLGDISATVKLSWEANDTEGINVEYFINTATLVLENKDPTSWEIIEDSRKATLTYNLVGSAFTYKIVAVGLEPNTEYSLIYYADFEPERFTYWGGNNPGALIGTMTTDEHGYFSVSNTTDLNMDLPSAPDANIDIYDYSGPPDYYNHAHGAKIWLVPSTDYDAEAKKLIAWNPTTYLFETDLIVYIDLDQSLHLLHPDPPTTTEIVIPAHTTIEFVIRFKFAPNAYGTYVVTTTVSP